MIQITYIALRTITGELDRNDSFRRRSGRLVWWILVIPYILVWPFALLFDLILREPLPDRQRPPSSIEQLQRAIRERTLWN